MKGLYCVRTQPMAILSVRLYNLMARLITCGDRQAIGCCCTVHSPPLAVVAGALLMEAPSIVFKCDPGLLPRQWEQNEFLGIGSWPRLIANKHTGERLTRSGTQEVKASMKAEMMNAQYRSIWVSSYMYMIPGISSNNCTLRVGIQVAQMV